MRRVDENDFVEFVGRVLSNPVGVQHTKLSHTTTSASLKIGCESQKCEKNSKPLRWLEDFSCSSIG